MTDEATVKHVGKSERKPVDWAAFLSRFGVLLALVACVIFFSIQEEKFRTYDNFQTTLESAAPLLMMALGLTVVLVMGDFDLSVSGMVAVSSAVVVATVVRPEGFALPEPIMHKARQAAAASGGTVNETEDRAEALEGQRYLCEGRCYGCERWCATARRADGHGDSRPVGLAE